MQKITHAFINKLFLKFATFRKNILVIWLLLFVTDYFFSFVRH